MLQHLGEHCIKWWKGTNSNCVDEGREVCIIDPALQVTKPEIKESIKDILQGLLNNMSLKNQSEWTSGTGTYGKMLNRLNKICYEVAMTMLKLYSLENWQ